MHVRSFRNALIALILLAPTMLAQDRAVIIGAGPVYHFPAGSMRGRFDGSVGWMLYAGKQINSSWTWTGKFEYVELSNLNESALTMKVTGDVGGVSQTFQVPLTRLSMTFKAAGLSAEATVNILRFPPMEINAHTGFGFTYWEHTRSGYYDSLFVQIPGSASPVKVAELEVPGSQQHDWSGSIHLGVDFSVNAAGPVWFTLGADYRLIIGELWQALDLDIENVSGIQLVSVRGTINVRF